MNEIMKIAKKYNLLVIEDNAHGIFENTMEKNWEVLAIYLLLVSTKQKMSVVVKVVLWQ